MSDDPIVFPVAQATDDRPTFKPADDEVPPPGFEDLADPDGYDPDADQRALAEGEAAQSRMLGPEVEPFTEEASRWGSPMDAFLSAEAQEVPTTKFKIQRETGFELELTVHAIPTPRYNRIIQDHTKWHRAPDGSRVQETRDREVKAALIAEALKDIDFKDRRLYDAYGGDDPTQLVERMFLRGEIERMAVAIAKVSGFGNDDDLEELAGN